MLYYTFRTGAVEMTLCIINTIHTCHVKGRKIL